MSSTHLYYGPFQRDPIRLHGDAQLGALMRKIRTMPLTSLDEVPVRARELSADRDMIPLRITGEISLDGVAYSLSDAEAISVILNILRRSEVPGFRGERAVLISPNIDRKHGRCEITASVGRNVWFNKHRMTAGFPATREQEAAMMADLSARLAVASLRLMTDEIGPEDGSSLEDLLGAVLEFSPDELRALDENDPRIGVLANALTDYRAEAEDSGESPTLSRAALDVLAERRRQIVDEGHTPEEDDEHDGPDLAIAASCYAASAADLFDRDEAPAEWPWEDYDWKPGTPRRDLVRAGALILAEIERLDRAGE